MHLKKRRKKKKKNCIELHIQLPFPKPYLPQKPRLEKTRKKKERLPENMNTGAIPLFSKRL
jgi:hypothetical protein